MLIGKELGPYRVDKELGSGAMGTVFRGNHKTSAVRVAIKLLSVALGSNQMAIARFVREVAILKQLDHPNIVKYLGSGRYHKAPFYIMEYVEGESLDHVLARRTRITWEEIVEIGIPLCAALQHAHDKGIIHRDLKPSNLMMLKEGGVKLTDFGIAKDTDVTALTAANSTVGTAAYMSPEQCRGVHDISAKTDLYSMGIMFYELVTGRKPFTGETAMEVFLQHANKTDFPRPARLVLDVPIWFDTLVCQLMEKDPDDRPFNAAAVADSLRLIKEKMDVQKSAGIEAATKRRTDRTTKDIKLDETDKDAARAMLGKKRKKKQEPPFYTKGWFTITAVGGLGLGLLVILYLAFVKAPSAEGLFSRAESLMKSPDETKHKEAREGPLADFLYYHPRHEKVEQIQAWADQVDFPLYDRQMHNRRNKKFEIKNDAVDAKEERMARDALDDEDNGKLADAAKLWEDLRKRKGNPDRDLHAWGVIGERYLLERKKVDELYKSMQAKIREERTLQKPAEATDDFERNALQAVREEQTNQLSKAKTQWDDLKQQTDEPSRRRWYLLSASRSRELRAEIEAKN